MPSYKSYVICTSPRSGSTLLCKLLSATGVSGKPASYFHEPLLESWRDDLNLAPDPALSDQDLFKSVISEVRHKGTAGTGMFGLRLQRHSFEFFFQKLAALHPDLLTERARFEAVFGETLFLHLTRTDKVDQAVSFVKAEQTGLWHQASDGTELERLSAPKEPAYDFEALKACHDHFVQYDKEWAEWFSREGITPYQVTYDDLSADPKATLKGILKALGADPSSAETIVPGTAKLADATNQDWADRLRANLKA